MSDPRLEQQLRSTLAREASHDDPRSPDFGGIVARAHGIRRQRHRRVGTALAAVAVVAVVVPTAVVLGSRQGSDAPSPAVSDTPTPMVSPSDKPSASTPPSPAATSPLGSTTAPGAPAYFSLTAIPAGPTTTLTYLDQDRVLHESGGTMQLPGKGTVVSFAAYHGGWLVLDDRSRLGQYDGQGKLLAQGPDGSLAVSGDRMQTAFQTGTTVTAGISSGMSDAETTWQVPAKTSLIGYLKGDPVVSDSTSLWELTGSGGLTKLPPPPLSETVLSDAAGLVGGVTGTPAQSNQQGAVADASTGQVLWQSDWRPDGFSSDGRYVAAYPVEDNGEPERYAILDARTGRVVATTPKLGNHVYLDYSVAWDDDTLVFNATDNQGGQALLSLDTSGNLRRVSPIERASNPAGGDSFRFTQQP